MCVCARALERETERERPRERGQEAVPRAGNLGAAALGSVILLFDFLVFSLIAFSSLFYCLRLTPLAGGDARGVGGGERGHARRDASAPRGDDFVEGPHNTPTPNTVELIHILGALFLGP